MTSPTAIAHNCTVPSVAFRWVEVSNGRHPSMCCSKSRLPVDDLKHQQSIPKWTRHFVAFHFFTPDFSIPGNGRRFYVDSRRSTDQAELVCPAIAYLSDSGHSPDSIPAAVFSVPERVDRIA